MVKKIVSILLATSLIMGGVVTKSYASTIEEIYKSAYDCTMKAVQSRDQASINEARKAIAKLPRNMDVAIGEFSKLTDKPQQELFEKFMSVLFYSNGNKKDYAIVTQDEINTAKELVISFSTYEGNKPYIDSWSSALDKFQQYKIDVAKNSLEYAEMVKTKLAKENAKTQIDKLLSVKNNDTVFQFALKLQNRLNAIVVTNENTNPTDTSNTKDPNVGLRPELSTEDGKDHYTDPTAYKQHIRFASVNGKAYFENIYNNAEGRWERYSVGFDKLQDFETEPSIAIVSVFKGNSQTDFRSWGPCVASFIKVYSYKDSSKNYAELIRMADGFVLEKVNQKGNIQVFNAPQISQQAANNFNTSSYDNLINKFRN